MKEYQSLLDKYSFEGYSLYSTYIPRSEWGKKEIAQKYLEKYWLSQKEYENKWKPIQDKIFINQDKGLPELVFASEYEILALQGGVLFEESDFKQLQKCFKTIGDKFFVIIENTFGNTIEPAFRMKYPADISWKELMSGNFISSVMCEMFHNEYFVFGESTEWGKYSANDYINALDLLGFTKKYRSLFKSNFEISQEEAHTIKQLLPEAYKNRIIS